jgi:SAM-dependent methyltransferase
VVGFAPDLADTLTGMDPASFAALWEVEAVHFWFRTRARLFAGLIRRYFPHARSFLEIGCGNGAVIGKLAKERVWERLAGSELHPSALGYARQRLGPDVELVQMDARAIPARNAFDLVGAFDVLEHIAEDKDVLREMFAVTAPGGGVIVAVPQHPFLWSVADDIAFHVRRYRQGEMETKLADAGFEVLRSTSFTSLLFPMMAASRFLSSSRQRDKDEMMKAEFHLSPLLNRVLGAITDVEVTLTLAGLSWPAGGSRVVLARRPQ